MGPCTTFVLSVRLGGGMTMRGRESQEVSWSPCGGGRVGRLAMVVGLASLLLFWSFLAAASARGSGWTVQRSPSPEFSSVLAAVSCPSASFCVAVGSGSRTAGDNPVRTFSERWSAGTWRVQPAPRAKGDSLNDVSCVSSSACIAVGGAVSFDYYAGGALAERWNGRRWTRQSVPTPVDGTLAAVSCVSANYCIAVGHSSGRSLGALTERWNGSRWKIEPTTTHEHGRLYGISCVSESHCIAVGSNAGQSETLAERWNGRSWKVEPTPRLPTAGSPRYSAPNSLDAVSCSSRRACIAVGTSNSAPLVERWNGRKWRITSAPNPAPTYAGYLSDISCSSPSACTTVGWNLTGGFVARWNGSKWTIQTTPRTHDGRLLAIACPSNNECTAVGRRDGPNHPRHFTLAERWSR
jgi:hypothetical protein